MNDTSKPRETAASPVLNPGEKVHIVQHRQFEDDIRRHFVGEILCCDDGLMRVEGFLFVFDPAVGLFRQVPPMRTRVFALDNQIAITILPPDFDMSRSSYRRDDMDLVFTDGQVVEMEIGAFGVHG